jgi:hypothetical protein
MCFLAAMQRSSCQMTMIGTTILARTLRISGTVNDNRVRTAVITASRCKPYIVLVGKLIRQVYRTGSDVVRLRLGPKPGAAMIRIVDFHNAKYGAFRVQY